MRVNRLLFNGSQSLNYLIHGQELHLTFHFPGAWFVTIYYNHVPNGPIFKKRPGLFWQRYHWFRKQGLFKSQINGFYPVLRITSWSPFPKRIEIPLTVNYVNVSNALPRVILNSYTPIPKVNLASIRVPMNVSDFSSDIPSGTGSVAVLPSSVNTLQDSFETFKKNFLTNPI